MDSLIIIPNDKLMEVLGDDVSVLDAYAAANDVLCGAVSGIAEVINNPGLVNVDFADVRTVMGEVGMAMMGSATASGTERARTAAHEAVKSPLLEDVNLAGARGVLVNITASSGLKMKEYHDVMNTIKEFTAEDAMVIVGTVIDDTMDDALRVTMIATGLGGAATQSRGEKPRLEMVEKVVERTGTDNAGYMVSQTVDYDKLDQPAVVRRRSSALSPQRRRSTPPTSRRSCASRPTEMAHAAGCLPRASPRGGARAGGVHAGCYKDPPRDGRGASNARGRVLTFVLPRTRDFDPRC